MIPEQRNEYFNKFQPTVIKQQNTTSMANEYYADHHILASKSMMRDPIKNMPKTTLINTTELTSAGNTYYHLSKDHSFTDHEEKEKSATGSPIMKAGKHTKLAKLQTRSIIAGKKEIALPPSLKSSSNVIMSSQYNDQAVLASSQLSDRQFKSYDRQETSKTNNSSTKERHTRIENSLKRIDANFNKLNINLQKYSEILNPAMESLLNRSDVVQEGESAEVRIKS